MFLFVVVQRYFIKFDLSIWRMKKHFFSLKQNKRNSCKNTRKTLWPIQLRKRTPKFNLSFWISIFSFNGIIGTTIVITAGFSRRGLAAKVCKPRPSQTLVEFQYQHTFHLCFAQFHRKGPSLCSIRSYIISLTIGAIRLNLLFPVKAVQYSKTS